MDFPDFRGSAEFIKEEHRSGFLFRLNDPAGLPKALDPHPDASRLQGDIFQDFPFARMNQSGKISSKNQFCMVLNNTCDLQPERSKTCNVALAIDYLRYEREASERGVEGVENHLKAVKNNEIFNFFFVTSCPNFSGGLIVNLSNICTVPMAVLETAIINGNRLGSLTQFGFYHYLIKLTRFFARPESDEVERHSDFAV